MSPEQLLELAGRYADGTATAEDVRELSAALRANPALRREFIRYMNIDSALSRTAGDVNLSQERTGATPQRGRRSRVPWWNVGPRPAEC